MTSNDTPRIIPTDAVRAVGRFAPAGVTGYQSQSTGEVFASRAEGMAAVRAYWTREDAQHA